MNRRKLFFTFLLTTLLSLPLYSQSTENINTRLDRFAIQLSHIIPNAATEQNVYSDAWIGYFVPSDTMHFAIGIEGGLTQWNMGDLFNSASSLHVYGIPETFAYPTLGINAKIGGFFIPFDLGVSFFTIDTRNFNELLKGMYMTMFVVGGNIRFAILRENEYIPCWSIGGSYYFSKGGLGCGNTSTGIDFDYETHILFAETQVSKKISFITPFAGYRAIFNCSNSSYSWRSADGILIDGTLTKKGSGNVAVSFEDSFTSQVFAGFGLTLGMFQIDTNVSYDINHNIWNGGISARIQM